MAGTTSLSDVTDMGNPGLTYLEVRRPCVEDSLNLYRSAEASSNGRVTVGGANHSRGQDCCGEE